MMYNADYMIVIIIFNFLIDRLAEVGPFVHEKLHIVLSYDQISIYKG